MLNKVLLVLGLQLCSAAEFAPAIDLQVIRRPVRIGPALGLVGF